MYASVSSAQLQPGKLDDFLTIYRESVQPLTKDLPGLKRLYVLTDANNNKGMTVAIYETEADAEKTQANGTYQQAIGLLAKTLVIETLERGGYEVNMEI